MRLQPLWPTKINNYLSSCKPIYHDKPVISNFCSHSAKPACRVQTKWYGKLCINLVHGAEEVGTESFFVSVDLLIHSEQYANTSMAVLIKRVTCKSSFCFLFGDKEKFYMVLSCEIYLRGILPCFFHGGALVLFWTAIKSAAVLLNIQVNLHFTHYAQGKYDNERKFMYLQMVMGFRIKIFMKQFICLLFSVCSFITLVENMIVASKSLILTCVSSFLFSVLLHASLLRRCTFQFSN